MNDRLLVTRTEAAKLLGLSADAIWRYTRRGVIPAAAVIRAGRKYLYRRELLEEWARRGLHDGQAEIVPGR